MFEISGNDISSLGDADLRFLVVRLTTAELGATRTPRTAGSMFASNAQQISLIPILCRDG